MNSFKQNENGILGNPGDIKKLAAKEEATILIISDSHGNITNLQKILKQFGPTSDALIFCGDGANDLTLCLNEAFNKKTEENFIPPVVAFVRGNGDPSFVPADFNPESEMEWHLHFPDSQILEAAGQKIYFSHGHIQGVYFDYSVISNEAEKNNCGIIIHGHTHAACHKYTDSGHHIICPGSVSLPRMRPEKSFCVLTIKGKSILPSFISLTPEGFESYNPFW